MLYVTWSRAPVPNSVHTAYGISNFPHKARVQKLKNYNRITARLAGTISDKMEKKKYIGRERKNGRKGLESDTL